MGNQCQCDTLCSQLSYKQKLVNQFNSISNQAKSKSYSQSLSKFAPLSLQINLKQYAKYLATILNENLIQSNPNIIQFEKLQQTNLCQIKFKNGNTYRGHVINHVREGEGQQKWADGTRYIGFWKNNLFNNEGTFIQAHFIYKGNWQNGKVEKYGVYTSKAVKYQGNWKQNQPHGYGAQTWSNGNIFKGQYNNGQKHGQGINRWPDKSEYVGEWKQGKIQGKGIYKHFDGSIYEGDFLNNMMHGEGIYKWPDGRKFVGSYAFDKKNGFGKYFWSDGRIFQGQWRQGKRNGSGRIFFSNGKILQGLWQDDKRIDRSNLLKQTFAEGQIKSSREKDQIQKNKSTKKQINKSSQKFPKFRVQRSYTDRYASASKHNSSRGH